MTESSTEKTIGYYLIIALASEFLFEPNGDCDSDCSCGSVLSFCPRCQCAIEYCDFPSYVTPDWFLVSSSEGPALSTSVLCTVQPVLPIGYDPKLRKAGKRPKPLKERPGGSRTLAKTDRKIVAKRKRQEKSSSRRYAPLVSAENCD